MEKSLKRLGVDPLGFLEMIRLFLRNSYVHDLQMIIFVMRDIIIEFDTFI